MSDALATVDPPKTLAPRVTWSVEVGDRIAALYADGKSLRDIGQMDGMPDYVTLWRWKAEHPEFATVLAHARTAKAEVLATEGCELVDEPLDLSLDGKIASAGVTRANNRANYRKWLAGCLDRETYGERPAVEVKIGEVSMAFARLSSPSAGDDD